MPNFNEPLGEVHTLVTNDGQRMVFAPADKEVHFIVYGNYGAPPTNFITRQGYRQDGETEVYFQLGARNLSVELHRAAACTRQQYWAARNDFHEMLRPNRSGPMTLTLRTPGNLKRSIVVRASPGMVFPPTPSNENDWEIDEAIPLVAFNPIWFDPAPVTISMVGTQDQQLVFPITFPIHFGLSQTIYQASVTYAGTWKAYPIITINGPFTSVILTNLTTGVAIYLNGPVLSGDKRVLTLTPGNLSVVDGTGNSQFATLGTLSNLVDWNLRPKGEVNGGINTIQALIFGATSGVTSFSLQYNNQYFAL
jgi:hypothetical protein